VVWLPTYDSENQAGRSGRSFSPVVRNGAVTPEVSQVIAIAAKNNLVLETGHSLPPEALIIIREAKRQGVQNVMVTHAMSASVNMSIAEIPPIKPFPRPKGAATRVIITEYELPRFDVRVHDVA